MYNSELFVAERPKHVTVLDRAGVWAFARVEILAAPWWSKKPPPI